MTDEHRAADPLLPYRGDAVARIFLGFGEVIGREIAIHGPNDPKASAIVGAAIVMLANEITARKCGPEHRPADPTFRFTLAARLSEPMTEEEIDQCQRP